MDEHHRHGDDDGEGQELPETDPQGRPYIGKTRVTETTRTRLVNRTCTWCGDPVPYSGQGRPPKYCSKAHRNRQWEVDTAAKRQERDREAGTARPEGEPVREIVRETVTRTATRSARIEVPGRVHTVEVPVEVERPVRLESAMEVCAVLSAVEQAVRQGRFPEEGLDHVLHRAASLIEAIQDVGITDG